MSDSPIFIRSSSLSSYPDCPRRGAARMFRKEIEEAGFQLGVSTSSIGAAVGTGVHAAAKMALDEKAKRGALPPVAVCEEAASDGVAAALSETDGPVAYDRETRQLSDAQKQAARMARLYHATMASDIMPIIVEERLEAEVAPGVMLTGQPDTIAREPDTVVDLKTGRFMGNHNPQIGSYSLLARTHGISISTTRIDFIPRVALTRPQPPAQRLVVQAERAETAAANVLRHIQTDLEVFRHGDPKRHVLPGDPWAFAANPSSKLCGAKYCVAHGTAWCHEWREEPEVLE